MENCIFCKIVNGELPSHKVWENQDFLAFLSIFPEIEGMTIVVPKTHFDSNFFKVEPLVASKIIDASREVAILLEDKLEDVSRVSLVFEGLEVPHLHAKLYPMYTNKHPIPANQATKANDEDLAKIANMIRL